MTMTKQDFDQSAREWEHHQAFTAALDALAQANISLDQDIMSNMDNDPKVRDTFGPATIIDAVTIDSDVRLLAKAMCCFSWAWAQERRMLQDQDSGYIGADVTDTVDAGIQLVKQAYK